MQDVECGTPVFPYAIGIFQTASKQRSQSLVTHRRLSLSRWFLLYKYVSITVKDIIGIVVSVWLEVYLQHRLN